jgi:hypothetical protein
MPSTAASILAAAELTRAGHVPWGTPIPESSSGVYVVALTDEVDSTLGSRSEAPLLTGSLERLLAARPELELDKRRPNLDTLAARLRAFWLPDETVVYIGLATSLRSRVRGYYRTPLGAMKPHAGGWWVKTLSVLDELWVHYAPTPEFETAEKQMLKAFADAVSPESRAALYDRERVMPFANLRGWDDLVKRHGITGATGEMPLTAD